jgi:hypothetical protein
MVCRSNNKVERVKFSSHNGLEKLGWGDMECKQNSAWEVPQSKLILKVVETV